LLLNMGTQSGNESVSEEELELAPAGKAKTSEEAGVAVPSGCGGVPVMPP
jgi:hypothetical protein